MFDIRAVPDWGSVIVWTVAGIVVGIACGVLMLLAARNLSGRR